MILLDTHTLLWLRPGDPQLGHQARRVIEQGWADGEVGVSAITFGEVAMLIEKGRLDLQVDVAAWRMELLAEKMVEIEPDGSIGIQAAALTDFHADPADRFIVATAWAGGHQLATSDRRILAWPGPLDCIPASD